MDRHRATKVREEWKHTDTFACQKSAQLADRAQADIDPDSMGARSYEKRTRSEPSSGAASIPRAGNPVPDATSNSTRPDTAPPAPGWAAAIPPSTPTPFANHGACLPS